MTDGGLESQGAAFAAPPTPEPLAPQPGGARFWTKRRVVVAVTISIVLLLGLCACAGFTIWRLATAEFETMAAMRPFIDSGYPDYRVIDSTRAGYILQHKKHETLRLDVRFSNPKVPNAWAEAPTERLSPEWTTVETFFRHENGQPADPRTNMNYDVDGFVEAYSPLMPGPNAVVSAVWLQETTPAGLERYVVLVARRNRSGDYVENMWPDHKAIFLRDSKTGEWTGSGFSPVIIEHPNR